MSNHVKINSSFIDSMQYDGEDKVLVVKFTNGTCHPYYNVPEELFAQMIASSSVGGFFTEHIRANEKYIGEPGEWLLQGRALDDISAGAKVEVNTVSGNVRLLRKMKWI